MWAMMIAGVFSFAAVPIWKAWERKMAARHKKEAVYMDVQEETPVYRIVLYMVIVIGVVFGVKPTDMNLYEALAKILLVLGVYQVEQLVRTRYYITNAAMYEAKRWTKEGLTRIVPVKGTDIHKVETSSLQGRYTISRYDKHAKIVQTKVVIKEEQDLAIFKEAMEKFAQVNVPIVLREKKSKPSFMETIKRDQPTRFTAIAMLLLTLFAIFNGLFIEKYPFDWFQQTMAAVIAIQFWPLYLYFVWYIFIQTRERFRKESMRLKMTAKQLSIYVILASSTLPFVVLSNHGIIEGGRFAMIQLVGFGLFSLTGGVAAIAGLLFTERKSSRSKSHNKRAVRARI